MQAVEFWNPSILSHFQLPFLWFQEGQFSPCCPYSLLEYYYSLVLCSFDHVLFPSSTFKDNIHFQSCSLVFLSSLDIHSECPFVQFLISASVSHQNTMMVFQNKCLLNFLFAADLQKVFCKYPEILPLAFYKFHNKNFKIFLVYEGAYSFC